MWVLCTKLQKEERVLTKKEKREEMEYIFLFFMTKKRGGPSIEEYLIPKNENDFNKIWEAMRKVTKDVVNAIFDKEIELYKKLQEIQTQILDKLYKIKF